MATRQAPATVPTHSDIHPLLDVRDLSVAYAGEQGDVMAVREASFVLARQEVLGLVGESGCGKSTLGLALLRLLAWPGRVVGGQILFDGRDLLALSEAEMRALRGERLAMIFQNPMTSLNPTETIGAQIAEMITTHHAVRRAEQRQRAIELLELVGIPGADRRIDSYPHELSGGMRQRALIALALALNPDLLVADEPTTALDLTVQGQILWLLEQVQREVGMAMIFITHNLAVASSMSHRIAVMYAGWIVETAPTERLFSAPAHPYTQGLIAAIPRAHWREARITSIPGQPPNLLQLPPGCPFASRCQRVTSLCRQAMPPVQQVAPGHQVRCYHAGA